MVRNTDLCTAVQQVFAILQPHRHAVDVPVNSIAADSQQPKTKQHNLPCSTSPNSNRLFSQDMHCASALHYRPQLAGHKRLPDGERAHQASSKARWMTSKPHVDHDDVHTIAQSDDRSCTLQDSSSDSPHSSPHKAALRSMQPALQASSRTGAVQLHNVQAQHLPQPARRLQPNAGQVHSQPEQIHERTPAANAIELFFPGPGASAAQRHVSIPDRFHTTQQYISAWRAAVHEELNFRYRKGGNACYLFAHSKRQANPGTLSTASQKDERSTVQHGTDV